MASTGLQALTHPDSLSDQTMHDLTRWACLAGGGLATYAGYRSGGASGLLMGVLGGVLAYQGIANTSAPRRLLEAARPQREVHLISTVTIDKPASELYKFWKGFTRLPQIMSFLDSVEPRGDKISHWVVKAPSGHTLEWDAEVTEDVPDKRIAWHSVEGSEMPNWGKVRFNEAPGKRGTEIHVSMYFEPPGGNAGAIAGHFLQGLSKELIKQNLRHLKAYLETGEIPTNITTSQGRRTS
ncbi:MAG: cyclase [Alteromonadaceae bacterium]|nr:cyclase [Alteromonadaceae bacterium]